jgi:hypothetical protein
LGLIEINKDPSARELRWFGVMFGAFFALVGAILWWRFDAHAAARVVWLVAGAVPVVYYAVPPIRRWLYLGWMYAAFPIGWTVSHLILAIVYYVVLTPIGIILRLAGRDPLQRSFDETATTYWIQRPDSPGPGRYFKQF